MSERLEPVLSGRLLQMLSGDRLEDHLHKVILLITLDERGWPYASMLSCLEVVAADQNSVRMAPWNNSTATQNLRRNPKVTLVIVDEGLACYVQGTATEMSRDLDGFPGMGKINVKIESILQDKALEYEGAARVTSGVRYENPAMDSAYIDRGRRILEALRK